MHDSDSTSVQRVFLPDIVAEFSCAQCGECCNAWEIPVDRDSYDRAVAALGDEARENLEVVEPLSRAGYARLKMHSGRCAFQTGPLCRIHRDHGDALLFPECRKFPRVMFATPVALHCTASFACAKMLKSLDRPDCVRMLHLAPQMIAFRADWCDTFIGEQPCLCRGKAMTWDAFEAVENGFIEILRRPGRSLECRLLTMVEFVRSLARDCESPLQKSTVDCELQTARVDAFQEWADRSLLAEHDAEGQVNVVLRLIAKKLKAGPMRAWERGPLDAAARRWGDGAAKTGQYLDDCRRAYLTADARVRRILENYTLCRVAGNPTFAIRDVEAGLCSVVALLALVRAVAVATGLAAKDAADAPVHRLAAPPSPITPDIALAAIRAVDTAFFHLPDFDELVRKCNAEPAALLILTPG